MWGGNGKNHSWAMGHHWLVALLVFQATLAFCDFGNTDSQNLADCKSYLYTIMGDVHQLGLGGISTDVYLILQELGYMDDSLNEIEQDIDRISRQMSKIGDAILTPTDRQIKNQVAVTNVAETYWLEKIYNELHEGLNYWSGLSAFTAYQYGNAIFPSEIFNDWKDYLRGDLSLQTFLYRWGSWNIYPLMFSNLIDFDNLSPIEQERYENYLTYQFFLDGDTLQGVIDFMPFDSLGPIFQHQYGTIFLQNMSTNTFFSGLDVNNFFTNGVYLSQYATNAFQQVADSSGINTNQMFLGSYGSETNSDILADITTNGLELVGSNRDYSSLGEDVSAGSLSNKVSMFNFTEKFDDSIKPFLDEIENASGGDWIINFGNIDLGDHFSFTIPALTVERNETYLGYVDKFLDVLKIILGVVFFLILWRQLEQAVEST